MPLRTGFVRIVPVVAALVLVSCESTAPSGDPTPAPITSSPEPTISPEPTVVPLSAADYQVILSDAAERVRNAFTSVREASSVRALATRLLRGRGGLDKAIRAMADLVPPEEVVGPHADLVGALRDYAGAFVNLAQDVEVHQVCGAPSAVSRLSQHAAGDAVRAATEGLSRVGYRLGGPLIPNEKATPNRTLQTGTYLVSGTRNGRGTFTIENEHQLDAVITMTRGSNAPAISVYVRGGDTHVIRGIRDGSYTTYTAQGADWDGELGIFTRKCSFHRYTKPLGFTTTYTSTQIRWTTWSVTLGGGGAGGGQGSAVPIDPGDFPT